MQSPTADGMQVQLETIYAEREQLAAELGTSDTDELIGMFRNLEAQLCDLYKSYGHMLGAGASPTETLLASVAELSEELDGKFGHKSISVEIVDEKPVLRATWSDSQDEGAHS